MYILLLIVLIGGFRVSAQPKINFSTLDLLADEALQLTKFTRYDEAKMLLVRFHEEWTAQYGRKGVISMDDAKILAAVHHDALKTIDSNESSHIDKLNKVTAFRLAMDAIASTYQPLWSDMEGPVLETFHQLKNSVLEGDSAGYHQSLNHFLSSYAVILPSLKIDLPLEKLQKVDAKIMYLDQYRSAFHENEQALELEHLEKELRSLFAEASQDETDPSLWWVMIMTGSTIILTLTYVSWRKFRGQKSQKRGKDSNR